MSTVVLIRHAEYDRLGQGLKGRLPGIHLNEAGRAQAERLAERLASRPLTAVYSSPLERTLETARPIAARHDLTVEIAPGLNEIDYGDWTGLDFDAVKDQPLWKLIHAQRSRFCGPGGERLVELQARMLQTIEGLCARHPEGRIVVVSHGDPIRAVLCLYLGLPLDLLDRLVVLPASISVLELTDSGPRLLRLNDTGNIF